MSEDLFDAIIIVGLSTIILILGKRPPVNVFEETAAE